MAYGQIVLLNGAPRSGKSSIVMAIQGSLDGDWINLGVDATKGMTPQDRQPGIGLRPGGERPDLEPFIERSYLALYDSIAAHSRAGLNIAADVGHHESYAGLKNVFASCLQRLSGLPVLIVGVLCPIELILERRRDTGWEDHTRSDSVPDPIIRWQRLVHDPGIYDLEVDTSRLSPDQCSERIEQCLTSPPSPSAQERIVRIKG